MQDCFAIQIWCFSSLTNYTRVCHIIGCVVFVSSKFCLICISLYFESVIGPWGADDVLVELDPTPNEKDWGANDVLVEPKLPNEKDWGDDRLVVPKPANEVDAWEADVLDEPKPLKPEDNPWKPKPPLVVEGGKGGGDGNTLRDGASLFK